MSNWFIIRQVGLWVVKLGKEGIGIFYDCVFLLHSTSTDVWSVGWFWVPYDGPGYLSC